MRKIEKKGAVELSIGTIVVIVLAMTMLIMGIMLVRNIFDTGINVVDIADSQLTEQVNNLFGDEEQLMLLPDSKEIKVKMGEEGAFAVGLKNLIKGGDSEAKRFSYKVVLAEPGNCDKTDRELEELIITGSEIPGTALKPGGKAIARKVRLFIPEDFGALCTFSYQVNSYVDGSPDLTGYMDVEITS